VCGAYYTNNLTELYFECGVVTESGGTVAIAAPQLLTPNSSYWVNCGVETYSSRCPAGSAVVGARVDMGQLDQAAKSRFISHIELTCAQVTLSGNQIVLGATLPGVPSVPVPPNGDYGRVDCPAGKIASGASLFAGEVIEGFAPRCVNLGKP